VDEGKPSLFWLDYLGTCQQVTRGAHGYAAYFLGGILDNYYSSNLDEETGYECVKKCIKELNTRFLISMTDFSVFIINKV